MRRLRAASALLLSHFASFCLRSLGFDEQIDGRDGR